MKTQSLAGQTQSLIIEPRVSQMVAKYLMTYNLP